MTVSRKLKEYLDVNGVDYEVLTHKAAFTAQQVAAAQDVTGWQVAKTVVLYCDGEFLMAVLQAPAYVDFSRIREILVCEEARLATESEMAKLFPGVELGAESPFGNLFDLPVYVDRGLAEEREIVFNAGTHTETIRLKYEDFSRLVNPRVVDIGKSAKV
jgi:Ala-tRNA(Pro) deacylase